MAAATDTSSQQVGLILYKSGEVAFLWEDTRSGVGSTSRGRGGTIGLQDGAGNGIRFTCDVQILSGSNDGRYLTPWGLRQFVGDTDAASADAAALNADAAADAQVGRW